MTPPRERARRGLAHVGIYCAAVAAAYRVGVLSRVPYWVRRWRDAAVIVSYHNVVPDGALRGERLLHVPLGTFRAQVERLAQAFRFVPLGDLLARHRAGRSIRGLAAISFDDGYRGVLRHALPVLRQLGLPATVFVVAGALARTEPFWWDRLADAADGAVPDRERWLTDLAGEEARILCAAHRRRPERTWSDDYLPASAAELAAVADETGVSLGLHTVTHPNLIRVSSERCVAELNGCWTMLRERFPAVLPVVAYPYGMVDAAVSSAAAGRGFGGVTLVGRPLTPRDAPTLIPRLFVGPGMSPDALEVAAVGLRLLR